MDQELLESLMGMGFPETLSRKALLSSNDLEAAVSWLLKHENDVDFEDAIPEDDVLLKKGTRYISFHSNIFLCI